jgi:hypothetical protein
MTLQVAAAGYLLDAGAGEALWFAGSLMACKTTGEQTSGGLAVAARLRIPGDRPDDATTGPAAARHPGARLRRENPRDRHRRDAVTANAEGDRVMISSSNPRQMSMC